MKKLSFLIFVLCICFYNSSIAQDSSSISKNSFKSWEIGYDLLSLKEVFNPGSQEALKHGFLLRKNYNNKAIRFKGAFFSKIDPDNIGSKNYETKRFKMEVMVGHEWQKLIQPKLNLFYGADLGYSWYRGKEAIVDNPSGYTSYQVYHSYSQHALADAFIGARFFINKHLSISIETALNIDWVRGKGRSESYVIEQNGAEILTDVANDTGYTPFNKIYEFSPLSKLYISYHF